MPEPLHLPLRILITCRELTVRAGSQLYTRDLAEVLRDLGQTPVVYSPRLGELAGELRGRGIPVIDSLDRLGAPPDVIHGQHHLEAMAAMLRFPSVPAVFVCHGWLPWQETPPRFPSLRRYVAVDELRRDRLVLEHGIAEGAVTILPNFIDVDRFQPRPPLPPRPRRALLYSNLARPVSQEGFAAVVAGACAAAGIDLEVAGYACGRPVAAPEALLPAYDLVFARGRAALEAMAVGAAVILCDREGSGPFVDEARFEGLRRLNFGLGTLTPPVAAERLRGEIERYDPAEAARVSARVRRETGRREGVARLLALYRELLREGATGAPVTGAPLAGDSTSTPRGAEECGASDERRQEALLAASRYLAWLAPYVDDPEALARSHDRLARALHPSEAAEAAQREVEAAYTETRAELALLRRSPFSRLRERLLRIRPLVAAYRRLRRSAAL